MLKIWQILKFALLSSKISVISTSIFLHPLLNYIETAIALQLGKPPGGDANLGVFESVRISVVSRTC